MLNGEGSRSLTINITVVVILYYISIFLGSLLLLTLLSYSLYRIYYFIKWYNLINDFEKLAKRLDDDIILLREGKTHEAILRESESNQMVKHFQRKYTK